MIEVNELYFSYTNKPFVKNMSFHVGWGRIFGFLGPSGVDKSTIQRILIGPNTRYKGSVKVVGAEICERTNRLYERIGVDFEFSTCYEKFIVRENLKYSGSLYDRPLHSTEESLRMAGLGNDGDKRASDFLEDMRSRPNSIKALAHNPDILLLDELASGFDPTNSRLVRDIIPVGRERGKTTVITMHNMFDAAELCDQAAFTVSEKISAPDTPHNLIMSGGATRARYAYFENGEGTDECTLT